MPSASRKSPRARRVDGDPANHPPQLDAPSSSLETRIHQRIEKRLGPRIHDLCVTIEGKTIFIRGRCATYYSKQLAQHAALGVIEDESLENAIEVTVGH